MELLNYKLNINSKKSNFPLIIFIHGLFGNLSNFNTLAQAFNQKNYNTLQFDLRNHGKSFHDIVMNYKNMAKDIFNLLDSLFINKCIVIGHSMGGKVAMTLPLLKPKRIIKIVVLDIAPVNYITYSKHKSIFTAIHHVNASRVTTRNEAFHIMNKFITNQNIIFFLLKSFKHGTWDFNIKNIQKNYLILNCWENYDPWFGNILFICGGKSSYVKQDYYKNIYQQFPNASIYTIDQAGHWIHLEMYNDVLYVINRFLGKKRLI